jgi:hypothetical protein
MNGASRQNPGAKAGAMDHRLDDLRFILAQHITHFRARLTDFGSFEDNIADGESPSNELVELHSPGDDVSTALLRGNEKTGLGGDIVERFLSDQGDLALVILLSPAGQSHRSEAITLQAFTGECSDNIPWLHFGAGFGTDIDGDHFAWGRRHDTPPWHVGGFA